MPMATKLGHLLLLIVVASSHKLQLEESCRVTEYDQVASAAGSCDTLTIGDLIIPEKTTLKIDLRDGAQLIFDGHVTHVVSEGWKADLIQINGTNVDISGTDNHLLDGLGAQHWKGSDEDTVLRPMFLRLYLTNSTVSHLKIKNSPSNCFMISKSKNVVVSHIDIDNYDGYPGVAGEKFAKNTDGFDVTDCVNVTIKDSRVINQDDCVAITRGQNLTFDNLHCNGSHGLSFSVRYGEASNIQILNSVITDSNNAIHIKGHNDDTRTGIIKDILYKNISFSGIDKHAISIQQNYPRGDPSFNVPIRNITFDNVRGTMIGNKSMAFQFICAADSCSDWSFQNVEVNGAEKANECLNVPSGIEC